MHTLDTNFFNAIVAALMIGFGGLTFSFFYSRNLASRVQLFAEIQTSVGDLRRFSSDIQAVSAEQAASTAEQSAAIEETRRTMLALVESASRIADASRAVLQSAERTANTSSSISEATRTLVAHAQRIAEISETIRGIADRSDLLALNAALEGTKAGEAGRGFSLIAVEMRRLAENVMEAVREIKQLVGDIRISSTSTVTATEEGSVIAIQTRESAHEITVVTQQQRTATEQVGLSMEDVRRALDTNSEGVRRGATVASDLVLVANKLGQLTATMGTAGGRSGGDKR